MPAANTAQSFGSVTKTLHWLTALLIFAAFPLGLIASDMSHRILDPSIPTTEAEIRRTVFLFSMHKTLGVTVFFVALIRIIWALGELGDEQAIDGLSKQLTSKEAFTRQIVVEALGKIGGRSATGLLMEAMVDPDAPVRKKAELALAR